VLIIFSSIILLIFLEGFYINVTGYPFDTCVFERKNLTKEDYQKSDILFGIATISIFFMLFQALYYGHVEMKRFSFNLFIISLIIIWHFGFYALLNVLKLFLDDRTCSRKPNSISGHYAYHIYYGIIVLYMMVSQRRNMDDSKHYIGYQIYEKFFSFKLRHKTYFFMLTYLIFFIVSMANLYRTWSLGFHSLKQIYLGIIFGVIEFVSISYMYLNRIIAKFSNQTIRSIDYQGTMISFAIFNIITCCLSLIFGVFPFGIEEIIFLLIVWGITFYGKKNSFKLEMISDN